MPKTAVETVIKISFLALNITYALFIFAYFSEPVN